VSDPQGDPSFDEVTTLVDPLVARAKTRIGQVLRQKWRLDVLLGVGGMAAVYAATHRNGSRAAVKILHSELSLNPDACARFLREGYLANSVAHDGAVKVIDDDTAEDGAAFLVMELLDGETLEDRRVRLGGRLSEDEVLSATDQLLDVLAAAQAKGIVHRDLKPENIFLTRAGQVKVLDFGIARLREMSSARTATQLGAAMGTPYYMAPEQARGLWDEVDGRTDLWAVGATMFHLLSGVYVHDGRTTNEVLLAAMTKPAPPIASVAPNIAPGVAHVVDRALAFDKSARWRDARHMQEGVRHAFHDRYGAPITTAPRLDVPATVPNRTLAGSEVAAVVPRLPTTGQPVEASRNASIGSGRASRSQLTAVLLGGVGALIVTVIGAVWIVSALHRHPDTSRVSTPSAVAVVTEPAAASPAPSSLPADSTAPASSSLPLVAATDLPTAAAPTPPPTMATPAATPMATSTATPPVTTPTARATANASAAAPAAGKAAGCNPPYTLDRVTGKKHFKAECL
jgi:serine/threonine-protein kinase